jgi:hypothetical protein
LLNYSLVLFLVHTATFRCASSTFSALRYDEGKTLASASTARTFRAACWSDTTKRCDLSRRWPRVLYLSHLHLLCVSSAHEHHLLRMHRFEFCSDLRDLAMQTSCAAFLASITVPRVLAYPLHFAGACHFIVRSFRANGHGSRVLWESL